MVRPLCHVLSPPNDSRNPTRSRTRQGRHTAPPTRPMKFRKGGDSRKIIPHPRKQLITGRVVSSTPQQPNYSNKFLGVKVIYVDCYGQRETILLFGCDIPIPAMMNAAMSGYFEVTLHTSAGDTLFSIPQPMGASNLSINHGV